MTDQHQIAATHDALAEEVAGEFAAVQLSVDHDGNGPRLKIEDLKTGHVGFLDALELETLAWLPEGGLHKLLDPSHSRWRDPQPDPEGWK